MSPANWVLGATEGLALGSLLFTLVMFLLLIWLLKIYAFGPLINVMRQRETFVKNQIDAAEKNRQETAIFLEEQRILMQQVRQEALEHIEAAKHQGEKEKQAIIALANQEAKQMIKSAKQEIAKEKRISIEALYEHTSKLTVSLASKILAREIDASDHKKLVESTIKEAGEKYE